MKRRGVEMRLIIGGADAKGYNMPGKMVDGNDVVQVYEAVAEAVARARRGEGPSLIEAKTYRLWGHWIGDPDDYRSREDSLANLQPTVRQVRGNRSERSPQPILRSS
jgi:TPP-dependent pyruvate/acetoin dehydrogenase alpha subunit